MLLYLNVIKFKSTLQIRILHQMSCYGKCNHRYFGAVVPDSWQLTAKAGFQLLYFLYSEH